MSRLKASDFDPEVLRLFDAYVHGGLSRRQFVDKAAPFTKGVTAAALLASLSPNYSWAQQVAEGDPSIWGQRMTYRSPKGHGSIKGYLVRPTSGGPHPAVFRDDIFGSISTPKSEVATTCYHYLLTLGA